MRYVLLLFCSVLLLSCASRKKEVINKSTIKLEGKKTNIRDLIDIDGFYMHKPIDMREGKIMFFEDGSCVSFGSKRGLTQADLETNLDKSIEKDKSGRWGIFWGVYTIQNDTIIVYSYDEPLRLASIGLSESRYKVVDRNTIMQIFFKVKTDEKYYELNSP